MESSSLPLSALPARNPNWVSFGVEYELISPIRFDLVGSVLGGNLVSKCHPTEAHEQRKKKEKKKKKGGLTSA